MLAAVSLMGILFFQPIYSQAIAHVPKDCEPGKCCVPGLGQVLLPGERASDMNGKCLEYICNDGRTYSIYGCPSFHGCNLIKGDPSKPYPGCCSYPDPDPAKHKEGCYGVA